MCPSLISIRGTKHIPPPTPRVTPGARRGGAGRGRALRGSDLAPLLPAGSSTQPLELDPRGPPGGGAETHAHWQPGRPGPGARSRAGDPQWVARAAGDPQRAARRRGSGPGAGPAVTRHGGGEGSPAPLTRGGGTGPSLRLSRSNTLRGAEGAAGGRGGKDLVPRLFRKPTGRQEMTKQRSSGSVR